MPNPNKFHRIGQHQKRSMRFRWGAAALCAMAFTKIFGPGCAAGEDPPSKINALRIVAVEADASYANPGEEVHFKLTLHDGRSAAENPLSPVQITWIGGCFNPESDLYYLCFEQLGKAFSAPPDPNSPITFAQGIHLTEFSLKLPNTLVSSRPTPPAGPHYGIAYIFFIACAGTLQPLAPDSDAPVSLPFACYDNNGRRLDADGFIAGYTQIYAFEDGRRNQNPAFSELSLNGSPLSEDEGALPTVKACPLGDDERRSSSCLKDDPWDACETYPIDILVDSNVAEADPGAVSPESGQLREIVWVNYYADKGDLSDDTMLISGAVEGYHPEHETRWLPPSEEGIASIWAVLRDSRGGSTLKRGLVQVLK